MGIGLIGVVAGGGVSVSGAAVSGVWSTVGDGSAGEGAAQHRACGGCRGRDGDGAGCWGAGVG
jgi:hypothetical protein